MNDILAQVATNTETSKNVGNAILYETVLSIMDIDSESGLRVLAVNILGRFLLNNDKNIRYVALNTLLKTVSVDHAAVQRHRATILDCLKDPDVTIKKRAMELCFALINSNNVELMSKDLIQFLKSAEPEFKQSCSSNMMLAAEQYAPDRRWHINTVFDVLRESGNMVRDDVVFNTIQIISSSPDQQRYAVHLSWRSLQDIKHCSEYQPLTQVASWCIGEFGAYLQEGCPDLPGSSAVSESEVVSWFRSLLGGSAISVVTKQYALLSLAKLSTRFNSVIQDIQCTVDSFGSNLNVDLQQRGVELGQLFRSQSGLRPKLLEPMPPMEKERLAEITSPTTPMPMVNGTEAPQSTGQEKNPLLELLDLDLSAAPAAVPATTAAPPPSNSLDDILGLNLGPSMPASQTSGSLNLLDSLGGGGPVMPLGGSMAAGGGLDSLLNGVDTMSFATPSLQVPPFTAYEKHGLRVIFTFPDSSASPGLTSILLQAHNLTPQPILNFVFQAAVPKSMQLQLDPPSSTTIPSGGSVTQHMGVNNPNKATLRMKLKIAFSVGGIPVSDLAEVNSFPGLV